MINAIHEHSFIINNARKNYIVNIFPYFKSAA